MPGQALIRLAVVAVPVSLTSFAMPFDVSAKRPKVSDLVFQFWNPNPFDCWLEGTAMDGRNMPTALNVAAEGKGYPAPARTLTDIYGSKRPMLLSAGAAPTPEQLAYMNETPGGFDWSNRVLYLIYGTRQ